MTCKTQFLHHFHDIGIIVEFLTFLIIHSNILTSVNFKMVDIAYVQNLAFIEILDDNEFEGQFWSTFGEFTLS